MSKIKKALEKVKSRGSDVEEVMEKVDDKEDIQQQSIIKSITYTKTKVLRVSYGDLKKNKIIAIDERDPLTDQFKVLRTQILNKTREIHKRTIQITSFGIGEGKSIIAANLAVAMAKETRQTTLLVDLDFRNPSIHKLFCLGKVKGLKDYFEKNVPLEELFINPGIPKLTILPAGGTLTDAPEIIGSPLMETLVNELKNRYLDRYIIFDTPAMGVYPDSLIFSEYADAILLVARCGVTDQDTLSSVMKIIPREKVLGSVLNDFIWMDKAVAPHHHFM